MNARLIVLALVIGCFLMGFAADVGAQAAPKPAPGSGPCEGIKVHGHWLIEVRNPDGTLATRREFQNALTDAGKALLAQLLVNPQVRPNWKVQGGAAMACEFTEARTGPCASDGFTSCKRT